MIIKTLGPLLMLLLTLPGITIAQDIHFSQFYLAPLALNPATAGIIKGDFRVSNLYRQQWKNVASPYKTYLISCDGPIYKEKMKNGSLGIGLSFYNDRAGDIGLATNQINLTLSANKTINNRSNLSLGLQAGLARRSMDAARLRSVNQFDGVEFHSDWSTNETASAINYSYTDFGVGLLWNFAPKERDQVHIGAAIFHVNNPTQSFYGSGEKSGSKLIIHGGGELGINDKISLNPDFLFQNQGESYEILTGALLRFEGEPGSGKVIGKAFSIGAGYRFDDAVVTMVVLEIAKWKIGFSYDINTSGLSGVSQGNGGFELSITFMTPNSFKKGVPRPSFL